MKYSAVILAAGMSSRMGSFKPLLSAGGSSYIRRIISSLFRAGIRDITVVGGNRIDELKEHLSGLDVSVAFNPQYRTSHMFDSVLTGLSTADLSDGVFITPVDAPLFSEMTVISLMNDDGKITVPVYKDRCGHPVFIPSPLADDLLRFDGHGGLNGFLSAQEQKVCHVCTDDPFILSDTDTPQEYERMLEKYDMAQKKKVPGADAIRDLYLECGTPDKVIRHCRKVRDNALIISGGLREKGILLDNEFLSAICLLHDVMRTSKDHASEAYRVLREKGFTKAAEAVLCHHDLPDEYVSRGIINETAVLYIADKITEGDRTIGIRERFSRKRNGFTDADALNALEKRERCAFGVMKLINDFTGERVIG